MIGYDIMISNKEEGSISMMDGIKIKRREENKITSTKSVSTLVPAKR